MVFPKKKKKKNYIPKQGVSKWGSDYWPQGCWDYRVWKYVHAASVRVYADEWEVDLKALTDEQKEWLKWRWMEDVDSRTSLLALIDEFDLPHNARKIQ